MVLKETKVLTVSTLGGCGGLERTKFEHCVGFSYCWLNLEE